MEALRRLYARLRLRVNEAKSAVARAWDRKFLGYSFWVAPGRIVKRRVAPKALAGDEGAGPGDHAPERRPEHRGRSLAELRSYLVGWKAVLPAGRDAAGIFGDLDEWIRRRLRLLQLKQWKRGHDDLSGAAARAASRGRGAAQVAGQRATLVADCRHAVLNVALPHRATSTELGVPRLAA